MITCRGKRPETNSSLISCYRKRHSGKRRRRLECSRSLPGRREISWNALNITTWWYRVGGKVMGYFPLSSVGARPKTSGFFCVSWRDNVLFNERVSEFIHRSMWTNLPPECFSVSGSDGEGVRHYRSPEDEDSSVLLSSEGNFRHKWRKVSHH